jgi:hypothetical protein
MAVAPALAVSKIAGEKTKTRGMLYEKMQSVLSQRTVVFSCCGAELFTGENHSTAVVWLCLGSSYSCLGYSHQKK